MLLRNPFLGPVYCSKGRDALPAPTLEALRMREIVRGRAFAEHHRPEVCANGAGFPPNPNQRFVPHLSFVA